LLHVPDVQSRVPQRLSQQPCCTITKRLKDQGSYAAFRCEPSPAIDLSLTTRAVPIPYLPLQHRVVLHPVLPPASTPQRS
jgi:hypothetical protein